jgi:integrase/recombinase XerC
MYDLQHRFGYQMAAMVPLHRLAQIMSHDMLDTTLIYVQGTKQDLQQEVEKIAWA